MNRAQANAALVAIYAAAAVVMVAGWWWLMRYSARAIDAQVAAQAERDHIDRWESEL